MSLGGRRKVGAGLRFPRVSGDEPLTIPLEGREPLFSPRERG